MTNAPFVIRVGPSGPEMPAGTPGYVLTVQADGLSVAPAPASGGAGGTPLTKCAWVDAAAPAGGNGFVSLEKAFNSIQDALDAGAESLFIAPGTYGNITLTGSGLVYLCGLVEPGRNGQSAVSIGTIDIDKTSGDVCLQNVAAGDVTDVSGVAVILTLVDSTIDALDGSGQTVVRTGTQTQNMDPAFPPVTMNSLSNCAEVSLSWANCAGAVQCSAFYGFRASVAGALSASAAINVDRCLFSQAVSSGNGTSQLKSSTFLDALAVDTCNAFDATVAGDISGDTGGGMVFRSSALSGTIEEPVTWDAETELRSLRAGVVLLSAFVKGLSVGQGADADIQTGNANLNFSGLLRSIYAQGSISADATVDFSLAGIVPGQMQTYALDVWNTAHTINVTFASAPVVSIPARAAGQGTRYLFQVTSTDTQIVLLGSRELNTT